MAKTCAIFMILNDPAMPSCQAGRGDCPLQSSNPSSPLLSMLEDNLNHNDELSFNRKRSGWLKNGNTPGDPNNAPRCGARTRKGQVCRAPAMANGRCRMHGGTSTGPRTTEGLARSRRARWKHGFYSAAAKAEAHTLRGILRDARDLLRQVEENSV